jgi:5-aminolevulinate synthase
MSTIDKIISEKLSQLKENGNYRYFLEVRKSATHFPRFTYTDAQGEKQSAINWCSNDYLGLSTHESVISKMSFTSHMSGAGSGGTRNISGTTNYHLTLEKTVAEWHQKEAALIFNSAYMANLTALQTLGRQIPDLLFVSDERNHASMIEGMRASGAEKIIFRHNDVQHLEEILSSIPAGRPVCVVFESVYSMNGKVAPLMALATMAKQYGALTYVDEVHAVGLYGYNGAGIAAQENATDLIDIINGTFSKALGVFGGYIATSASLADFIRSFGSGFIFTTSLPPAICAAATVAIQHVQQDDSERKQMHALVQTLRQQLQTANIFFTKNDSHITCIHIGDAATCKQIADTLLKKHSVYLQPINYPTVPEGEACLRIIVTAKHTARQINHLVYSLQTTLNEQHQAHRTKIEALTHTD